MSSINVPVLNALCDYVSTGNIKSSDTRQYDVTICNLILSKFKGLHRTLKDSLIDEEKADNQLNMKDKIRLSVVCKQVESDTQYLIKQFESSSSRPIMRNWKFKESKLFSMIIWAIRVIDNQETESSERYDCIMSLTTAMNEFGVLELIASNNDEATNIDKLINSVYDQLSCYTFLNVLLHDYSELIVSNFYTINYPYGVIKPYPAQKNVIDIYKQSLSEDRPLCINYSTETGSGKTYLSLALARALKSSSTYRSDDSNNAFIFVCYNITVRKMIVDMCDKLNIPGCLVEINGTNYVGNTGPCFNLNRCAINVKVKQNGRGNARSRVGANGGLKVKAEWRKFDDLVLNGTDEEKIRNQFIYLMSIKDHSQSFSAAIPQVYVCDPESAAHFVKIAPGATVFIDEPDVDDAVMAAHYANILGQYPKRVIISSATIGAMDSYVKKFQITHPDSLFATINHGTAGIHSTLIVDGKIVLPHMFINFDDSKSREVFLEQLATTSIIKLYSPLAIAKMFKFYNENVIPDRELVLENYFNWRTISYDKLREFILEFFNSHYHLIARAEKKKLAIIYAWNRVSKPFTVDNHWLTGQTLSISNNPLLQASVWEDGLFNLDADNAYSIKDARRTYLSDLRIYQSTMEKIKSNTSAKESRQMVEHKIAEHSKNQPSMNYPSTSVIGSKSHSERFTSVSKMTRAKYNGVDDALFDAVDHEILKWFYAGVGFYDDGLPKPYITSILNAAQSCELACMMSLPELVRGMDYRFDTVMVDKLFGNSANQSTLRQTIGRVGRPGSNKALVIFEDLASVGKLFDVDQEIAMVKRLTNQFNARPPLCVSAELQKIKKFSIPTNKGLASKPIIIQVTTLKKPSKFDDEDVDIDVNAVPDSWDA